MPSGVVVRIVEGKTRAEALLNTVSNLYMNKGDGYVKGELQMGGFCLVVDAPYFVHTIDVGASRLRVC